MRFEINGETLSVVGVRELGADNSQAFREEVRAALPDKLRNIEIDLSQTNFLDSCGLGALISLRKTATSRNGKVRLLNPSPRVQLLFDVTRMHKIFEIVVRTDSEAVFDRLVSIFVWFRYFSEAEPQTNEACQRSVNPRLRHCPGFFAASLKYGRPARPGKKAPFV